MEQDARIHTVDALRGFALLGILYVHVIHYFLGTEPNQEILNTAIRNSLDPHLSPSTYWIGLSKFYSIFSMLFGLSFYIQMRAGKVRLSNFRLRFFWKLLLLAGFGILHRMVFMGDILVVYALVGMLLIPASSLSNTTLAVTAVALLGGLGRAVYLLLFGTGSIFEVDFTLSYETYLNAVLRGTFLDIVSTNLEFYAQFWNEQLGFWGRFYNTFGYFILGLLIGRLGILEDIEGNLRTIRTVFAVALACAVLGLGLHLKFIGFAWDIFFLPLEGWQWFGVYGVYEFFSISMTFLYASGFILLAHGVRKSAFFRYLSAYGRTGLTSYVSQSVLGTFLFFNWGLGLIHEFNFTMNLLTFFVMAFIQMTFSYHWLQRFRYGPLEWLWRSLTFFEWVPNRRR